MPRQHLYHECMHVPKGCIPQKLNPRNPSNCLSEVYTLEIYPLCSTNGGPLTPSSNYYLNCYREDMNAIYKSLKMTVVHAWSVVY